jgi:peptidoglycan/xylan/chitin deacetylase (PgdA/CDA1 family)
MINDEEVLHLKYLYNYKTITQFVEDIDYLLKYYNPITIHELLVHIKECRNFTKRSFFLTFDDGFRELYDVVAPILYKKGVPAVFFVNSAFINNKEMCYQHKASLIIEHLKNRYTLGVKEQINEICKRTGLSNLDLSASILSITYKDRHIIDELARCLGYDFDSYLADKKPYLDSEKIENLIKRGFSFGAHSIDHPFYKSISLEEQIRQTVESLGWLKNNFPINYGAFAFPHSDNGVTENYFNNMRKSGDVDVFFGTGGMVNNNLSDRLQRFSLEKPILSAKRILAYQYIRGVSYRKL